MTTTIVALDLETTGLDPERHHIWEIGAIVRDHRDGRYNGEWHIMLRPRLDLAEPMALRIGRYYERAPQWLTDPACPAYVVDRPVGATPFAPAGPTTRMDVARWLAAMLDGATMVGCVPNFDAAFLARFLRTHWQAPTWHYHLVDVEALAAGWLAGQRAGFASTAQWLRDVHASAGCDLPELEADTRPSAGPPWRSDDLSRLIGVEPPGEQDRHTALGDARWALAIYDKVLSGEVPA